jgi:hypothetical protein
MGSKRNPEIRPNTPSVITTENIGTNIKFAIGDIKEMGRPVDIDIGRVPNDAIKDVTKSKLSFPFTFGVKTIRKRTDEKDRRKDRSQRSNGLKSNMKNPDAKREFSKEYGFLATRDKEKMELIINARTAGLVIPLMKRKKICKISEKKAFII